MTTLGRVVVHLRMTAVPLAEEWVPELGQFLRAGFGSSSGNTDFAAPEVVRWKFFDPRRPESGPRCYVARDKERILACIGSCPGEICRAQAAAAALSTLHPTDWLTSDTGKGLGGVLLTKLLKQTRVQHALGCAAPARPVLLKVGFREVRQVPLFHKVRARTRPGVWRALHGRQPWWRGAGLLAVDFTRSVSATRRAPVSALRARRVPVFGGEVEEVLRGCVLPITYTTRQPALLNHYLRFPKKSISGWLLEDSGQVRGFGLLSVFEKAQVRIGRIVDCFLATEEAAIWRDALGCLEQELAHGGVDVISCYGSTPWLAGALRANGFFPRGRTAFYLRDPEGLVPADATWHLTHLEADAAYL